MSLDVASGRWHTVILSMPHNGSLRAILKDKIFQGGTPHATFAGRIVYVAAEFSTIRLNNKSKIVVSSSLIHVPYPKHVVSDIGPESAHDTCM